MSPQLPIQVPIEMDEQGVKYAPRPLPTIPGAQGTGMVRKNSAAPTFLLTDSPIASHRRSLPGSGLGGLNSAGLETDSDPFNPSISATLNPFVNHPFNPRDERALTTTTNKNNISGATPASIHAPLHVNVHPASYYEGDDKYNEFGYELEYDPWTDKPDRQDGDVKIDLDKDLYEQEQEQDAVADLPRMGYNNSNQSDAVPKALSQRERERERMRNRAVNFSRPMRGGASYRTAPRTRHAGSESDSGDNALGLTLENVHRHNVADSDINPIVHSFMSPLGESESLLSAFSTQRTMYVAEN